MLTPIPFSQPSCLDLFMTLYSFRPKRTPSAVNSPSPAGEEAVKKFGNAKSISSDMYFGGPDQVTKIFLLSSNQIALTLFWHFWLKLCDVQDTRDANLSRFQGSASISSDMYFNRFVSNFAIFKKDGKVLC